MSTKYFKISDTSKTKFLESDEKTWENTAADIEAVFRTL